MTNTIDRIVELYQKCPESLQALRYFDCEPFSEYVRRLRQDPPADFSLGSLDVYKKGLDLSIVFAHLPPTVLHEELGESALFWTWVRFPYEGREKLLKSLAKILGKDQALLKKCSKAAWTILDSNKASDVKSILTDIDSVNNGFLQSVDLPSLLRTCANPGVTLSDKRVGDYALVPLNTEKHYESGYEERWGRDVHDGDRVFAVYLDTPIAMGLMYKGRPNAVVSFLPQDGKTVMIYQLQGIQQRVIDTETFDDVRRVSSRGLAVIDWQRVLVECVRQFAVHQGYDALGIRSGHNNSWTEEQYKDGTVHLPLEEAIARYDMVAERLGFTQREKEWYICAEGGLRPTSPAACSLHTAPSSVSLRAAS
jgi:hypothetical protein